MYPNFFTRSFHKDSFWAVLLCWVWEERAKLVGNFDIFSCVI